MYMYGILDMAVQAILCTSLYLINPEDDTVSTDYSMLQSRDPGRNCRRFVRAKQADARGVQRTNNTEGARLHVLLQVILDTIAHHSIKQINFNRKKKKEKKEKKESQTSKPGI